jgi:hypothetical protein
MKYLKIIVLLLLISGLNDHCDAQTFFNPKTKFDTIHLKNGKDIIKGGYKLIKNDGIKICPKKLECYKLKVTEVDYVINSLSSVTRLREPEKHRFIKHPKKKEHWLRKIFYTGENYNFYSATSGTSYGVNNANYTLNWTYITDKDDNIILEIDSDYSIKKIKKRLKMNFKCSSQLMTMIQENKYKVYENLNFVKLFDSECQRKN